MRKQYEGDAPAKIILFGEHAVVYNQPAIAAPVSTLRVYVSAQKNEANALNIIAKELGTTYHVTQTVDLSDKPLEMICQLVLRHFEVPVPSIDLHLTSHIPIASGLGSGAAISTALARALAHTLGKALSNDVLNEFVYEVEKIHHGTPSGIDNTVIVYEQLIRYVRDQPIERISLDHPFFFVIADTGIHAPTYLSVGDVRKLMETDSHRTQKLVNEIGCVADKALDALQGGDTAMVGNLMVQNHNLLKQLTVSSKELDHLVETALDHGAYGAKLSGGGRGGNMIALVQKAQVETIKQALLSAGAYRVLDMTLGKE